MACQAYVGAPIVHVEEANGNQVFLIWRAPASGYESATDTFIFNAEGKILRQNVVVHYSPVQKSWDNHFAAFGGQDVDRILLDYTEDSEIIVYDQTSGGKTVFTGLAGVRDCFTGLFARLSDTSDLTVPVVEVNEAANGQPGSVFLVWRCPASGYAEATDTFIFDSQGRLSCRTLLFITLLLSLMTRHGAQLSVKRKAIVATIQAEVPTR